MNTKNTLPLFQAIRQRLKTNPYKQHFNTSNRQRIGQQIREAEQGHRGEIRVVVETGLPISAMTRGKTARQQAIQWFSDLAVWDTELNTGILLYILLSERKIEIVADRGISNQVPQAEWDAICQQLQSHLSAEQVVDGIGQCLQEFQRLLQRHFPLEENADNPDELSNELIFIK